MENKFDIFGKSAIEVNAQKEQPKQESVLYAPKAKDTQDGTYRASIRFLYNPKDPINGSILKKIVYYLKDREGKGHYFDSPQSVGDWNGCPMGQLWKQLDKSESAIDKKNAKELNKRDTFYSLVYIINDEVNPALNGKIKILKYGKKLKAKLDRYLEPGQGKEKIDIFNFYNGYDFDLNITRQGNFNNYDEAGFMPRPSMISIPGLTGGEDDREILENFMSGAPDLEAYRYQPMTDEQRNKLENILNQWRPTGDSREVISSDKGNTSIESTETGTSDLMDDMGTAIQEISVQTMQESAPSSEESDEDLDGFLNSLGI